MLPIPPRCTRAAALSTCAPVTELQLPKKVVGAQLPRVSRPGLSRAAGLNLRDVNLAVLDLALDLGGALAVDGAAHGLAGAQDLLAGAGQGAGQQEEGPFYLQAAAEARSNEGLME